MGRLGLGSLLRKRARWLAAGMALIVLGLIAAISLLGLSGWFITASALAGAGLLIGLDIFTPGAGIRLAALTRTVARYGERVVTHELTFRLLADLRLRLFDQLLQRPNRRIAGLRRGDTLQRLTRDIDSLDQLFIGIIGPSVAAVLVSLLALLLVGLLDWTLALFSIGLLLLVAPLVTGLAHWRGRAPSRQAVELLPRLRTLASDGIDGINELRALDRTAAQAFQLVDVSRRLGQVQQRLGTLDALGQGAMTLIHLVTVWIGLLIGLTLLTDGQISGPILGLLVLGLIGLGEAWQPLPAAWRRLGLCQAAAERLEPLTEEDIPVPHAAAQSWPAQQGIRFERIDFRYSPHSPRVLVGFDLRIEHGETLVVSGASGIGKTSLARLLLEEVEPQAGRILIGDRELRDLPKIDRQRRIAYLPQQPVLFADSLAANLRLAREDAQPHELLAVLEKVGLTELVETLPDGIDSWIEENGRNLSGGQQRRLALARLLLSDPDIVILDEPTAGLDPATARDLMQGLESWLSERTAILISHDPLLAGDRRIGLTALSDGTLEPRPA